MLPDVVKCKYSSGVFFVKDQEWKVRIRAILASCSSQVLSIATTMTLQVGERYELLHLLGVGSFSSVCCALDKHSGLKVRYRCLTFHTLRQTQ